MSFPMKSKGYNTYIEHSIPGGEHGKMMTMHLRSLFENPMQRNVVVPYCTACTTEDIHEDYLHDYIKENSSIHAYVMVPGTNIFEMLVNAMMSVQIAKKVYVAILKDQLNDQFDGLGGWKSDELEALDKVKEKLQKAGIITMYGLDKLASSIEFSVNSINDPIYRDPSHDQRTRGTKVTDASRVAAEQVTEAALRAAGQIT